MGEDEDQFQDEQALEFSRHYDNLLWGVTSLLTAANAALLAISGQDRPVEAGILGIALSNLAVFFAASFRLLRKQLHDVLSGRTNGKYRWLHQGPPSPTGQWTIFVLFFWVQVLIWVSLLWRQHPRYYMAWSALLLVSTCVMGYLFRLARYHTGHQISSPTSSTR